jgi:hypothetical protein
MDARIDTRELKERIEELESLREDALNDEREECDSCEECEECEDFLTAWNSSKDGEELKELESIAEEIGSEFIHGVTLILEDDFEEYAQELAEDTCGMPNSNQWPFYCIDWEYAAKELLHDYSSITYKGQEYYYLAS